MFDMKGQKEGLENEETHSLRALLNVTKMSVVRS